jgi:hypothetical protein
LAWFLAQNIYAKFNTLFFYKEPNPLQPFDSAKGCAKYRQAFEITIGLRYQAKAGLRVDPKVIVLAALFLECSFGKCSATIHFSLI